MSIPKEHQHFSFHVKSTSHFILKQHISVEKIKYMVRSNGQGKQKWSFSDNLLAIKNTKPISQQTETLLSGGENSHSHV